ncbi:hypothetical protein [Nocardia farcinica]|uniref:hypothetical protein n=1 Tax=Nocardia farcinica TaxID=37329 RepID=UPI0022B9ED02|nr:hypothetical protein [Nocardia farcinica]MCZ9324924.1 hypothetical protein [Nocardia farcinica]
MTTLPVPVDPPRLPIGPTSAQGRIAPSGPARYVGGRHGVDVTGALLDGLAAQTERARRHVLAVLDGGTVLTGRTGVRGPGPPPG